MENDLRRLMLDPNRIPLDRQSLLADIARQAASLGATCYLVGGFARDLLLNEFVDDFDVVVEGDAIKLGEALVKQRGGKLIAHRKFGTAIWRVHENEAIDLITARSESYRHAGALPTIKPSTIEDDLRRRDFAVNALAVRFDGDHLGEVLDPLDGRADLAQGLIRVLHPRSFVDDPTRVFRAVRYEQRYGFNLHPDTAKLINRESFETLSKLSGERIRHEFDLIFEEENFARMLSRLNELGVFDLFAPRPPKFNEDYSGLINSRPPAEFGVSAHRVLLGYSLWLMDLPANAIESISKRLRFTSELRNATLSAAQLKNDLPALKDAKPSAWTMRLEKIPPLSVYAVWLISNASALKEFLVKWRRIKANVTGDDLKVRGVPTGPRYKEILSQLRAARLDGEVKNEQEEDELLNALL